MTYKHRSVRQLRGPFVHWNYEHLLPGRISDLMQRQTCRVWGNSMLLLLLLFSLLSFPVAAQEIGTLTLVEGSLQVIRGTAVLKGVEGMRVRQGDILQSSDRAFAQIEFRGGTITALGASSRLFLYRDAGTRGAELVLLSGWLKGQTGAGGVTYHYASPLLAATTREGTAVLHAVPEAAEVFVETGSAGISEVSPGGNLGHPGSAKAGQFFTRRSGKSVAVLSRPDSTFLESMPVSFRDTFPSRLSRFAGKALAPKRDHEVTYSEIEDWLNTRLVWREGFVSRFEPRLEDAAFRKAVEAHLGNHPEWDEALYPEDYEAKTPVSQHSENNRQHEGDTK
jgi:hypothetical protein